MAYGQSNEDVEHARWINGYHEIVPFGSSFQSYLSYTKKYCTTTADTVQNGLVYTKLMECGQQPAVYRGGLRVDGDRWYFLSRDSATEMLLYDFGLQVGDTLQEPFYDEIFGGWGLRPVGTYPVVQQVDTLMVLGIPRRHVFFEQSSAAWIEGIGCAQGLLWGPWPNISMFGLSLECYSKLDTTHYASSYYDASNTNQACQLNFSVNEPMRTSSVQLYPNPSQGKVTFYVANYEGPVDVSVYSSTGKQVFSTRLYQPQTQLDLNLPAGHYFLRYAVKDRLEHMALVIQ